MLMRRIIYGLLGLLGILTGIALLAPFFINVNDYKPEIIAKARESIGRDVVIDGNISLHLLPQPQLRVDGITIRNIHGATAPNLAHVKRLDITVDLLPLLKKQVRIKTIELNHPEIFLEKLPNGQTNWQFKPLEKTGEESPSAITFDHIQIHQGKITYHEKGKDTALEDINASLKFESLNGPYGISASFTAFGQAIKLDTKLGATSANGLQDVFLKAQIDQATLTLEGQTTLSPVAFKGHLIAQGNPKALQTKEKTESVMAGLLRLEATVEANEHKIHLQGAKFAIGSAQPTGEVTILLKEILKVDGNVQNLPGQGQLAFSIMPSTEGVTGSVTATLAQAHEFLDWLEIETSTLPPALLGSLSFSSNFTMGEATQFHNLKLNIQDAQVLGDVSWQPQQTSPLLTVNLSSPKIEKIFKLLGVQNPKPLGMGKFQSTIQWDKTSFHLNRLKGQLGQDLTFSGDVAVQHGGAKPQIKANLSLNKIRADTLLATHRVDTLPLEGNVILIAARPKPQPSHSASLWSHAPLDFGFLNKFDGEFLINAHQLSQKEFVMANPKLSATVQNGRLDIHSLNGSLFGGAFTGKGHLTADNALHFAMALNNANLKNLPTQGANVKIVGGTLNFSSDLSTYGKSMHGLIQNLKGPVHITATQGVINGFDLHALSQQLGSLQNPASLIGLLTTTMGKGQTRFSSFKGDLLFNQGVGTIQSMNLVAPDGQGQASGQIDLPRYLLNIQASFQLTQLRNIPPFHMNISGPINNPSRKLDTSALQKYMMENVFKGVIDTLSKGKLKAGNVLGSILGGDKNAPSQDQPKNPGQVIEGLVKGLF